MYRCSLVIFVLGGLGTPLTQTPFACAAEPPHARIVGRITGCGGEFVRFSPDGKMILTAGGRHARVWDAITLKPITGPLPQDVGLMGSLDATPMWSADGCKVLTATSTHVRLFDVRTGQQLRDFESDDPFQVAASMASDASRVATVTGFMKGNVNVWDTTTGRRLWQFPHDNVVDHVAFNPNGSDLLMVEVLAYDRVYHVWHLRTGEERFPAIQPQFDTDLRRNPGFLPVSFSLDGMKLLVANSSWFTLYDAHSRKFLAKSPAGDGFEEGLGGVRFSPDGRRVVTSFNHYVQAWDARTAQPLGRWIRVHTYSWAWDLSPDGNLIACALEGSRAGIWDLTTGEQVVDLSGESNWTFAFSPDGKRLAAAVRDGHTTIWSLSR